MIHPAFSILILALVIDQAAYFVGVLGYELTSEFKNEKGSRKADGAVLKDGNAIAVVELKGMDTTDLTSSTPRRPKPQCLPAQKGNLGYLRSASQMTAAPIPEAAVKLYWLY